MAPAIPKIVGAADGNRTHVTCLEGRGSTIELQPRSVYITCLGTTIP